MQDYVEDVRQNYAKSSRVFHVAEARRLKLQKLDPCLGLGFLVKNAKDFICFVDELQIHAQEAGENAIFSVISKEEDLGLGASEFQSMA